MAYTDSIRSTYLPNFVKGILTRFAPETVIARLRALRDQTGLTSLLLHYPPSYGHEKTMQSLRLFAERVMPAFRPPTRREAVA